MTQMTHSQLVLDAFVQRGSVFVHCQTLHRASALDAARFDAALEQLLGEQLLARAGGGFYVATPWMHGAHARMLGAAGSENPMTDPRPELPSVMPDGGALAPDVAALVDEFLPRVKATPPNQRGRVMQEFQARAQRLPGDGAKLATQELLKRLQARGPVGSGAGRRIR